jgi:hypothetical protein
MRLLFVFLFFSIVQISAQIEKIEFFGLNFQYNSLDLFGLVNYGHQCKKFEYNLGFGLGVNRTFFQKKTLPIGHISSSYYFLNKDIIQLGPTLLYQFSYLRFKGQDHMDQYYNQISVGYTFAYGKKLKVCQSTFYGLNLETYYSTFLKNYNTLNSFKFSAQIGLKYEL